MPNVDKMVSDERGRRGTARRLLGKDKRKKTAKDKRRRRTGARLGIKRGNKAGQDLLSQIFGY